MVARMGKLTMIMTPHGSTSNPPVCSNYASTETASRHYLFVFAAHVSRDYLTSGWWCGQHQATGRVIAGGECIQDLNANPVGHCNNITVCRVLNHLGAFSFVPHLSTIVVSAGFVNEREEGMYEKGIVTYTTVPL